MNRLISLLLVCAMLLSLCACGENTADTLPPPTEGNTAPIVESQTPPPTDTDASTDEEPESPPPAEDGTTVPDEPDGSEEPAEPEEYTRTIDPYGKMVALTFDDGPHPTYSSMILDILEEHHAAATFFEVGRNARSYPDILRRMSELGCEIASHSNVHHDLTTLSRNALLTDLGYADDSISSAAGVAPTLVRPPYGAVNSTVKYETGRAMITWTVDTQDWRLRDAQKLFEYFQSLPSLDGEVVLLHSIHGSTAEAMAIVVPWLIEQGYQLVTVSELMAYYYGVLLEPNVFYDQNWFLRHGRTEYPLELPTEPMQTQIPEYTVVPVVPITEQAPTQTPNTPSDTPAPPPSDSGTSSEGDTPPSEQPTESPEESPEEPENPSQEPEAPSQEPENPSEEPEAPNSSENEGEIPEEPAPPSENETPSEPTPPEGEGSGTTPSDREPQPPTDEPPQKDNENTET